MIAFTGTPISGAERDTRQVFGDYIDVYDLTRAVNDGATVPVYYESRLIPVSLPSDTDPEALDEQADKATEGLDDSERRRVEQAAAALNAVYGAALAKVRDLVDVLGNTVLVDYPWRKKLRSGSKSAYRETVLGVTNYLRDPKNPLNQVEDGEPTLKERFTTQASRLARFFALCASIGDLNDVRDDIAFFRDVRVWVVKFDAAERQAGGKPIPADVELYLKRLTAGAIEAGDVTDLFTAAGMERPDLSRLDEAYIKRMQEAKNPALAIEALRRLVQQEMRKVTRHNVVRQQSFSDRLLALMRKYTNQNLTAAEIIAELVAMAKEVAADADRGNLFDPKLTASTSSPSTTRSPPRIPSRP